MRCPQCNGKVDTGAWICPFCDYILDPGVLGIAPEPEGFTQQELTRVTWTPADALGQNTPDAVILGDLSQSRDLTMVYGPGIQDDGLTANYLYYSTTGQRLIPSAVPTRLPDPPARPRTPYEDFIYSLVDGRRDVAQLERLSGLTSNEVTVSLLTLMDHGAITIETPASQSEPPPPRSLTPTEAHPLSAELLSLESAPTRLMPQLDAGDLQVPGFGSDLADPADQASRFSPSDHGSAEGPGFDAIETEFPMLDDEEEDEAAIQISTSQPSIPPKTASKRTLERPISELRDDFEIVEVVPPAEIITAATQEAEHAKSDAPPQPPYPLALRGGARDSAYPPPIDPVRARKAMRLHEQAMKDLSAGNQLSAQMNMKLAITFDPHNLELKQAFESMLQARQTATVGGRAHLLYNAATQAEAKGDPKEAIRLLRLAILSAREAPFLNRLGVLLAAQRQDFTEAEALIQEALRIQPGNPTYKQNLKKVQNSKAKAKRPQKKPRGRGFFSFLWRR